MHRTPVILLALALACTPRPTAPPRDDEPKPVAADRLQLPRVPEHLEMTVHEMANAVIPIIRGAANGRAGPKGEWKWTDAERAALERAQMGAHLAILAASPEDRPWLLITYIGLFTVVGIGSEWADAVLEVPPSHPAWSDPWGGGLFEALDECTDPQRFHEYIAEVAAEHDTPQIQSGVIYLELEEADRTGNWERAHELFARLQSPELRDGRWQFEAELYFDPNRALRADRQIPEFCAPAIAGPQAGQSVCLNELFPHDQQTLIIGWASWCKPCNEQLPQVIELVRDQPLRVITISYDDDAELAREHLHEFGVDGWTILQLTIASREQREFRGSLDAYPIPFMALADGQGLVLAGPPWLDAQALAARLD
jgi:thiol-disulfide isomerase/thioredoxin